MADTHDLKADREPGSASPGGMPESPPFSAHARLEDLVRQKEVVARLSVVALSCRDLQELFDEACRVVVETLRVEYCKVLELMSESDGLLLRAGAGWDEGYVGRATVGTNLESQAGYTLISRGPIIVEDLKTEVRFKGAPLLHDHEVTSGVTVAIRAGGHFFGVFGTHSRARRAFTDHDVLFLEDVADLLGAAIERQREEDQSFETMVAQSERIEAAERRFEFLAGANALLLASSTDYTMTLRNMVRLAVPVLADWCFVDLVEPGGDIRRAAVGQAKSDSGGVQIAEQPEQRYPADPSLPHGTARVLKTGRPELLEEAKDAALRAIATDPEQLTLLRGLPACSYMCVPLRTGRGQSGAIGLVSSERRRRYGEDDLAVAEGLAHCAALALDSAAGRLPEIEMAREIVRLSGALEKDAAGVSAPDGNAPNLTRRQLEVLNLMSEGYAARQIANLLYISEDTVRNHIRAIKYSLDASSQLEAIARARRLGLLPR